MKILLIQCLRGNEIGEIEIENINQEGYFYYNFGKEALDEELEPNGIVFCVQYKSTKGEKKQCCGMALGKYKKLGIDNLNSEKGLLKILDIKQIKFGKGKANIEESDEYKEIKEIIKKIKSGVLNNTTHNLIQIQIHYDKYKKLKQLANNITGTKDKKADSKILESYNKLERKKTLCKLAQRSIYAKRVENKGDSRENRTEYQRDWERIIHSKSFRRLEDKAQIYTLAKGDHFRTRLTHTLEVTQIARGIARELNLNEDLVEAIALGHDLGHTPFGHVGERTLNKILEDEKVEGGFKHNFQGIKVVNYLEEKYGEFEGIDLTYQVMEGILKHTKTCNCDRKDDCHRVDGLKCQSNKYCVGKFLRKGDVNKLHPEYNFASTLEGQVVAVADEIAQRSHDLDDGIASGIIKENDFLDKLRSDPHLKKLSDKIEKSLNYIDNDKRGYIDDLDIKRARIVSDIITYFIREVVKSSRRKIKRYKSIKKLKLTSKPDELVISKELICFDKNTSKSIECLNDITSKVIIGSQGVKRFDSEGENVIKELYKAYSKNPIERMLPNTLKRITREISKYMNDVVDVAQYKVDLQKIKNGEKESQIISAAMKDLVEKELEIYAKNSQDEIDSIKHRIFVRSIVDFIAGMTDEFAIKQFKEIYLPITY